MIPQTELPPNILQMMAAATSVEEVKAVLAKSVIEASRLTVRAKFRQLVEIELS